MNENDEWLRMENEKKEIQWLCFFESREVIINSKLLSRMNYYIVASFPRYYQCAFALGKGVSFS